MPERWRDPEMFDGAAVHPIIENWPDFWWMSEEDRAIAFDARARAYGGTGWISRPSEHGRER